MLCSAGAVNLEMLDDASRPPSVYLCPHAKRKKKNAFRYDVFLYVSYEYVKYLVFNGYKMVFLRIVAKERGSLAIMRPTIRKTIVSEVRGQPAVSFRPWCWWWC